MKPFNLEEAIELHKPVVTRDGRDVWLAGYNPNAEEHCRIIGWLTNGHQGWWCENGKFRLDEEHDWDLFMKPTEKYVGFFTYVKDDEIKIETTGCPFNTEEKANQYLDRMVKTEFWHDIQNRQVIKINV